MSLRSFLSHRISSVVLSERRLEARRTRLEAKRIRAGAAHRVEFFHQLDDPYSHLLAEGLLQLVEQFEVEVATWLVRPPDDWAAPERSRLRQYSLLDATRLAAKANVAIGFAKDPSQVDVESALSQLVAGFPRPDGPGGHKALELAVDLGRQLWRPDDGSSQGDMNQRDEPTAHDLGRDHTNGSDAVEKAIDVGTRRRSALGHYLGGTCWYAGEWTWGLDRLHYLQDRLVELGAERTDAATQSSRSIHAPPLLLSEPIDREAARRTKLPDLHFFLSFRSPYTSIVIDRAGELADAFGVTLRLRFVLPMVMRGLPVHRSKRRYILLDTAREARRLGVPFGPVADPLGKPVERGYSLLPWAIDRGRGREYCSSFLRLVWSEAVDAGSQSGLRRIVENAGLDWTEAQGHVDDDAWRSTAEANREELFELGLWGVPSFRVGSLATWGQDRLWVLEDHYRQLVDLGNDS